MSYLELMHPAKAAEQLAHYMFHLCHGNWLTCDGVAAYHFFETLIAELHHDILYEAILVILRVKEIVELHDVWSSFQLTQNFILARNVLSSFLSAF